MDNSTITRQIPDIFSGPSHKNIWEGSCHHCLMTGEAARAHCVLYCNVWLSHHDITALLWWSWRGWGVPSPRPEPCLVLGGNNNYRKLVMLIKTLHNTLAVMEWCRLGVSGGRRIPWDQSPVKLCPPAAAVMHKLQLLQHSAHTSTSIMNILTQGCTPTLSLFYV